MTGSVLKNISMFRKLCGTKTLKNVVIVTTKWDAVPQEVGEEREEELMTDYFEAMLELGAKQARHNDTTASAQAVLRKVLGNRGETLRLQQELVDEHKTLGQTEAGAAVGEANAKLREKLEKEKEELRQQIEEEHNEKIRIMLEQEQQKLAAVEAKMEADNHTLEANREKQMVEYQKRLDAIAEKAGESPTDVMIKGVSILFQAAVRFLTT